MSYGHANYINQRSVLSLATEKFNKGQSLVNAIGSSLSDKTSAKFTSMKERLDPMSWSKKIGGKLGAGIYGRMMGRSAEDMYHYTGVRPKSRIRGNRIPTSKSKNPNINPLYTKISSTSVTPVRKNDSVSDILSKIYNYMKLGHEKDIKLRELRHNNKKGLLDDADKKHKAFLKTLAADDKAGPSGGGGGDSPWTDIFDKIFDLGKFVLGASLIKSFVNRSKPKTPAEKMGGKKPKEKASKPTPPSKKKGGGGKPKTSRTKSVRSPIGTKSQGEPAPVNKKPHEKFKPGTPKTPEDIKKGVTASKEAKTTAYNKEYPTNAKGGITSKPTAVKVLKPTAAILKGAKEVGQFTMNQLGFKSILSKAMKIGAIMDAWDQIQKLDKTKFNTTNKYNAEITKIIMKVVAQYGVAVVLMGLGGTLFNFMFPGVGAVAGAIVGFILGAALVTVADKIFTDSELEKSLNNLISRIANWFWGSEDIKKYNLDSANYIKENIKGPNGESYVPANDTDVAMSPGTKFGDAGYHDKNDGQFKKFTDAQMAEQLENFTKQNSEGAASTIVETVRPYADKVGNTVDSTIDSGVNAVKDKLKEHGWMDGKPTEDIIKESVVNALSSVVTAAHNAPKLHIEKGSVLAKAIDEYNRTITEVETQRDSNIGKNNIQEITAPPVYTKPTKANDVSVSPTGDTQNKSIEKYTKYIPFAG